MAATVPSAKKPLASSILLWMRTDQRRQHGMDYVKDGKVLANYQT